MPWKSAVLAVSVTWRLLQSVQLFVKVQNENLIFSKAFLETLYRAACVQALSSAAPFPVDRQKSAIWFQRPGLHSAFCLQIELFLTTIKTKPAHLRNGALQTVDFRGLVTVLSHRGLFSAQSLIMSFPEVQNIHITEQGSWQWPHPSKIQWWGFKQAW